METLNRSLEAGAVLAALLVSAFPSETQDAQVELESLSKALMHLQDEGLDISDFSLSPGGYYSQDIVAFVGNLLSSGYATQSSPVKLSTAGLSLCRRVFSRALLDPAQRQEAEKVASVLGIDLVKLESAA